MIFIGRTAESIAGGQVLHLKQGDSARLGGILSLLRLLLTRSAVSDKRRRSAIHRDGYERPDGHSSTSEQTSPADEFLLATTP